MANRHYASSFPILTAISLGLAGCGSGDETTSYKLVPVSGTISVNGKPTEGVQVTFNPSSSNASLTPGLDTTGPDGNYKMMFRDRSGLAPGKYTILLTKTLVPPGQVASADEDPQMARAAARARAEVTRNPKDKKEKPEDVPMQFQGSFEKEVASSGGVIDLDLKGKASPIPSK